MRRKLQLEHSQTARTFGNFLCKKMEKFATVFIWGELEFRIGNMQHRVTPFQDFESEIHRFLRSASSTVNQKQLKKQIKKCRKSSNKEEVPFITVEEMDTFEVFIVNDVKEKRRHWIEVELILLEDSKMSEKIFWMLLKVIKSKKNIISRVNGRRIERKK